MHCSLIYGVGRRTPTEGQHVEFQYEAVAQGSFDHRAVSVAVAPPGNC